jgi:hypothetical protein
LLVLLILTAVMTMAAMHEDVHERTSQQWKPNQKPQHMGPVLGEQQRASDDQKAD